MCGKIACTVRWGVAGDGATATAPAAYPTDQVIKGGAGGAMGHGKVMATRPRPSTARTVAGIWATLSLGAAHTLNPGPSAPEVPSMAVRYTPPTPSGSSTGLENFSDPK